MIFFQILCLFACLKHGNCEVAVSSQSGSQESVSCDLYEQGGPLTSEEEKWVIQSPGSQSTGCPPCSTDCLDFTVDGTDYLFRTSWTGNFPDSENYCQSLDPDAHLAGKQSLRTGVVY